MFVRRLKNTMIQYVYDVVFFSTESLRKRAYHESLDRDGK